MVLTRQLLRTLSHEELSLIATSHSAGEPMTFPPLIFIAVMNQLILVLFLLQHHLDVLYLLLSYLKILDILEFHPISSVVLFHFSMLHLR